MPYPLFGDTIITMVVEVYWGSIGGGMTQNIGSPKRKRFTSSWVSVTNGYGYDVQM